MKSILSHTDRAALASRFRKLAATQPALWGKFTAPRMVSHLVDSLRMATGEVTTRERRTILARFPVKHLALYVLPFPKGVPTAPELLTRPPGTWADDVEEVVALMDRIAARTEPAWPRHPVFGSMSAKQWGVLAYRHCDHHLRQFGA